MSISDRKIYENRQYRTVWSRRETVFLAAAGALLAGVVLPIPDILLDILWVCVLSLTIAAATIFPAAASTADLKGFALLLIVPALLRIGLVGAAGIKLLQARPCGLLIPALGKTVTVIWPLAAALAGLAAAVVLLGVLFATCQKIAAAGKHYLKRIGPLKCVGIETDLKMGILTAGQAQTLAEKVGDESRLFAQLSGASLLMRTEGAIEITAMLACLIWPFLGAVSEFGSGAERIAQASASAVGLAIVSLIPAVLSAAAGAYLAGKDSLTLRSVPDEPAGVGRVFTLVDKTTGRGEAVELLNPDFTVVSEATAGDMSHEQLAEFEPQHNSIPIETPRFSADTPQGYYRQLAAYTTKAAETSRIVVFAAEHVRDLPVTTFVNTAIELAQQGHKLLLIDADQQRHALAQVFDVPPEQLEKAVQATVFDGLDLFGLYGRPQGIPSMVTTVVENYACLLIYAPSASVRDSLVAAIEPFEPTVFVFGFDDNTPSVESALGTLGFCRRLIAVPPPIQT